MKSLMCNMTFLAYIVFTEMENDPEYTTAPYSEACLHRKSHFYIDFILLVQVNMRKIIYI
jgi:hypothetical protein